MVTEMKLLDTHIYDTPVIIFRDDVITALGTTETKKNVKVVTIQIVISATSVPDTHATCTGTHGIRITKNHGQQGLLYMYPVYT